MRWPRTNQRAHRRRILFIDDDADLLSLLCRYFAQLGYEVHSGEGGLAGIGKFEQVYPDVTVVDLKMPDLSGIEVLERLRRRRAAVIMLTGQAEVADAVEAMRLGAENFLTKPIDMPHLAAAVEKAAEQGALRRHNVELRARLSPNFNRRRLRAAAFAVLAVASAGIGAAIGSGRREPRPREPIPVLFQSADTVIPMSDALGVTIREAGALPELASGLAPAGAAPADPPRVSSAR